MRRLDVLALVAAVLWLGGNATLAFAAMSLFPLAKVQAIDVTVMQLGEVFGILFHRWVYLSSILLALLLPTLFAAQWLRLRRAQQPITGWLLLGSGIVLCGLHLAVSRLVLAAVAAWTRWDGAAEGAEKATAWQTFTAAHQQSTQLSGALTAVLLVLTVTLAVAIARRAPSAPATRA
jgi:hypothetical protein